MSKISVLAPHTQISKYKKYVSPSKEYNPKKVRKINLLRNNLSSLI